MDKVERTRTFTGCGTCRNRHVKCDGARPECGPCRQFGQPCGGYWSPLLWITEGIRSQSREPQGQRGFEYRYPVLNETQRRQMSQHISESLGEWSAADLLSHLNASCWKLESKQRPVLDLVKGPFGVFSAREETVPTSPPPCRLSNTPVTGPQPSHDQQPEGAGEETQWPLWLAESNPASCDDIIFSLDPTITLDESVPVLDPFTTNSFLDTLLTENLPPFDDSFDLDLSAPSQQDPPKTPEITQAEAGSLPLRFSPSLPIFTPALTPAPADGPVLPIHAEPLLRHYKQEVQEPGCNESKRKSPCQLILFPCALEAFAELSLWRSTSHTRFALLYGLLSLSAFRLDLKGDSNFHGERWYKIGVQYQRQAQRHLRTALEEEMSRTDHAKYKELLMAILAVSMISLSRGGQSFQVFLLDAERFIRRQGLTDDIPFESRPLHHTYSYLRVLAESVGAGFQTLTDDPTRAYNEPPEKGGKFRLAEECYDVCLDPAYEKDRDLGYSDIHLQIQGQWSKTLFPAVYGLPEGLWTLLSQTIATANEKSRIESLRPTSAILTTALTHHIQGLERAIWAWTTSGGFMGPERPTHLTSEDHDPLSNPQAKSLALALHQALLLYFYRTLYNLSPMVLQDMVSRTFDHLEPCMTKVDDQDLAVCIAWAVLIGGCEASTPQLQERALALLKTTDERGVFLTMMPSAQVATSIWEKRKKTGD